MSTWINRYGDLMLTCNACKTSVMVMRDQTNRLIANDYIHENGWKTAKISNKWVHFCPKCRDYYEQKNRERFFAEATT